MVVRQGSDVGSEVVHQSLLKRGRVILEVADGLVVEIVASSSFPGFLC